MFTFFLNGNSSQLKTQLGSLICFVNYKRASAASSNSLKYHELGKQVLGSCLLECPQIGYWYLTHLDIDLKPWSLQFWDASPIIKKHLWVVPAYCLSLLHIWPILEAKHLSHKKSPIASHYTSWLIGFPTMGQLTMVFLMAHLTFVVGFSIPAYSWLNICEQKDTPCAHGMFTNHSPSLNQSLDILGQS